MSVKPLNGEAAGVLDKLRDVAAEYGTITAKLNELQATRDSLIRQASILGASRRTVAAAAGVTVGRVQQIVDS